MHPLHPSVSPARSTIMGRKSLHKSLHSSLSKLKWPFTAPQLPDSSRFLSAWKYPMARSLRGDPDRFLIGNFSDGARAGGAPAEFELSPRFTEPPPEVIRAASQRFFVSASTTGSLVEEARLSAASLSSSSSRPSDAAIPGGGEAVLALSSDPHDDFRRSMEGMVEAWHVEPGEALDWDFMEELLFCYLELNDRSVHRYILRAFTDLTVSLERGGEL